MHDWVLLQITFDWESGGLSIQFKNEDSTVISLIAKDTKNLLVPRRENWGQSINVNEVNGPFLFDKNTKKVEIEMQSGDLIEIIASEIIMPNF